MAKCLLASKEDHSEIMKAVSVFAIPMSVVDHPTTCGYGHTAIAQTPVKKEQSLVDAMIEHKRLSKARTHVISGGLLGIDAFTHMPSMLLMSKSDPTSTNNGHTDHDGIMHS